MAICPPSELALVNSYRQLHWSLSSCIPLHQAEDSKKYWGTPSSPVHELTSTAGTGNGASQEAADDAIPPPPPLPPAGPVGPARPSGGYDAAAAAYAAYGDAPADIPPPPPPAAPQASRCREVCSLHIL